MKLTIFFTSLFLTFLLPSCSNNNRIVKLEYIKNIGDNNPILAIEMLDSLELDMINADEYTQNKFYLLKIRLNDKALITHTSDVRIKKVVEYFEKVGTDAERQEVYYYAGSVYRDLQDSPRALENFFKSIECARTGTLCDSFMLRNAYSNLCFLLFRVQSYNDAISIAKEELKISHQQGFDEITSYMHIGAAYKAIDSLNLAMQAYDNALRIIMQSDDKSYYQEDVIRLFMDYSIMKNKAKALACKTYIEKIQPEEYLAVLKDMSLGCFYELSERNDSAIYYFNKVIRGNTDIDNMYDATKHLFHIYTGLHDVANAHQYACIYMRLSDSLDFGKRQELASTVNNAYKYHMDEKKEQSLKDAKERYRLILIIVVLTSSIIVSILTLLFFKRRNAHLRRLIRLSAELKQLSDDDGQLREEIKNKELELRTSEELLAKSNKELNQVKEDFKQVNSELNEYNDKLKAKEKLLIEKIEQNRTFIKLLHQSELEGNAKDVIRAIRQSSTGKRNMTSADWKQLYQAIDDLYPNFKDKLLTQLGTFTELQMQVCYLMRIGLSKSQIQNMTNLSRATVWRWSKKYDWVIESDSNFT